MNKRIFRYMSLLIFLTILFFASLWALTINQTLGAQIQDALPTLRVSIIDKTGNVIFDNTTAPTSLENHLNRPEILQAIQNGRGKSKRFSDTRKEITYYYASRLPDQNILRLAITTDSITSLLYGFIPLILLCLLSAAILAFLTAKRLTKKIIAPINNIDLDSPELVEYDELAPFLKKIETQKRQLASQLSEIENRSATIATITENMKEGLLLLDKNGKVLLANESASNILEITEAAGKTIIETCRDPKFLKQTQNCLAGEKTETVMRIKDRFYNVFFTPVTKRTQKSGAAVLFIDITERYAAEAQRKEFSANVSHELKTPLTTIMGLSEMIADGTAKDQDVRPFAHKIKDQSQRLIDVVNDIIKLSEFDEGETPKDFTRFNLYNLTDAVIASLHEKALQRDIKITLHGNPNLPLTANMRMIDELLYNLLDNAIKYNRDGGYVQIHLLEDESLVKISVKDNGIGVPSQHTDRIFERFYRIDKSRSKKTGGTGLGLSIVKHIAEFHGGYVSVESIEGEGSTFTCTLKKNY